MQPHRAISSGQQHTLQVAYSPFRLITAGSRFSINLQQDRCIPFVEYVEKLRLCSTGIAFMEHSQKQGKDTLV